MMTTRRWIDGVRCLWKARDGMAMMEFFFVAPFLIVLMAGGFEFGRAFYQHESATKAVRDAARYLARVPDPTLAVYQDRATNLAYRGSTDSSAPMLLEDWAHNPSLTNISIVIKTFDNSAETFRGPAVIQVIQVTNTVQYQDTGLLSLAGITDPITYAVSHEQRYIGD